jgi:S-adenosylmethionine-dependent methyltransferase
VSDPFSRLADPFLAHQRTLRGLVRYTLVGRQLEEHLPPPPARVADIGGGAGQQSIPLARNGYEVTILDPSPRMLGEAHKTLASEGEAVRRRVRLVQGEGERGVEILGAESFNAVLCHGVLMYLEDPRPIIHELASIGRPGAMVCVLAKNASALALPAPSIQAYCSRLSTGRIKMRIYVRPWQYGLVVGQSKSRQCRVDKTVLTLSAEFPDATLPSSLRATQE